ncbi:hypothetical protein FB451DRAFT_1170615 [Mycena latifolia]|nr:hypothetical protein FB451DRAFT_1170615 [Mycena latifolia]
MGLSGLLNSARRSHWRSGLRWSPEATLWIDIQVDYGVSPTSAQQWDWLACIWWKQGIRISVPMPILTTLPGRSADGSMGRVGRIHNQGWRKPGSAKNIWKDLGEQEIFGVASRPEQKLGQELGSATHLRTNQAYFVAENSSPPGLVEVVLVRGTSGITGDQALITDANYGQRVGRSHQGTKVHAVRFLLRSRRSRCMCMRRASFSMSALQVTESYAFDPDGTAANHIATKGDVNHIWGAVQDAITGMEKEASEQADAQAAQIRDLVDTVRSLQQKQAESEKVLFLARENTAQTQSDLAHHLLSHFNGAATQPAPAQPAATQPDVTQLIAAQPATAPAPRAFETAAGQKGLKRKPSTELAGATNKRANGKPVKSDFHHPVRVSGVNPTSPPVALFMTLIQMALPKDFVTATEANAFIAAWATAWNGMEVRLKDIKVGHANAAEPSNTKKPLQMPSTVDTVDTIVIVSPMFCRELGDGHQKGHSKLPKLGDVTPNSCSVATRYPKIFVTPPARLPPYRLVTWTVAKASDGLSVFEVIEYLGMVGISDRLDKLVFFGINDHCILLDCGIPNYRRRCRVVDRFIAARFSGWFRESGGLASSIHSASLWFNRSVEGFSQPMGWDDTREYL